MNKGFCGKVWKIPVEAQKAALLAHGLIEKNIYVDGFEAQDLTACLDSFRATDTTLYFYGDGRVLAGGNKATQDSVAKALDAIALKGVKLVDLAHPEHKTLPAIQRYANSQIAAYARWQGNKDKAKRVGRRGGLAKGEQAAIRRAETYPEGFPQRMVAARGQVLTWQLIADLLGEGFTISTIQRLFGGLGYARKKPKPAPKRRKK